MTRNEYKKHDWKVGEYLYEVTYNRYMYFAVPWKIKKVKILHVSHNGWIYIDNKDIPYSLHSVSPYLKNFFFDRKNAKTEFDKQCKEFTNQKDKIRKDLQTEWNRAHHDFVAAQAKINGLLRMKIMNDGQ